MADNYRYERRCVRFENFPDDATERQLRGVFEEIASVKSLRLAMDRVTGISKGYGLCEFQDEECALSAIRNFKGYKINGRELIVDFPENFKKSYQNRGGSGAPSNADASKQLGGTSVSLHQPGDSAAGFEASGHNSDSQFNRPSKLVKLNDGQAVPSCHIVSTELPSDVDPTLLQQVKSLTPAQLSILSEEERIQVIELQQRLTSIAPP